MDNQSKNTTIYKSDGSKISNKLKQFFSIVLKVFISAFILLFLFRSANLVEGFLGLQNVVWGWVLLAFAVIVFTSLIQVNRWRLLIAPLVSDDGLLPTVGQLFLLNLIGFFYALFLPGSISGDIAKGYRGVRLGSKVDTMTVSIIFDKLVGVFVLFCFGSLTLLIPTPFDLSSMFGILSLSCTLLIAVMMLLISKKRVTVPQKLQFVADSLQLYYHNGGVFMYAVVITCITHSLGIVVFYLLSVSLGLSLSLSILVWVYIVYSILIYIPITFAGIGLREAGIVGVLSLVSVSSVEALSFSFLQFFLIVALGCIGGVIELVTVVRLRNK